MSKFGTSLVALTCLVALAPGAEAQSKKKAEKWRIDPYTKNEPELMKKAGYVKYHPIEFGEHTGKPVSSETIEDNVGKAKMLWVETAHFKIGSALPAFAIPASDRKLKKKLEGELKRLKKKLPKVNHRTRKLDRWLRLHLFAQRCEDLYADFSKRLKVDASSFPKGPKALLRNGQYWGEGPYLGQNGKYHVLMFDKASDFSRYISLFLGRTQTMAVRHNYKKIGSLLVATAAELDEGSLKHDTRMHCHIVFNVTHNLINGYRFYAYDLPVWFNEGMAHWFSREVNPKYALDFDQNEGASAKVINDGKWKPRMRRWMGGKHVKTAADLLSLRDFGQLTKYDHVMSWSVCDYLMSLGDEKWRNFMNEVKGYVDPKTGIAQAKQILPLQRKGLKAAYKFNALQLEERWRAWVKKTYPAR